MFRNVLSKMVVYNRVVLGEAVASSSFSKTLRPVARYESSLISQFEASVSALPEREAVRYTAKNMKWTAADFKMYADSHANALLEHGFTTGDTIAVWLPDAAEKHVTLLAAAKMGMRVVDIDPAVSTVKELRTILAQAECKALFFEPTNEKQDNMLLLRKTIPEFFHYDDTYGQFFHSKHFPVLKYFIHTGFDLEMGALNYKSLFLRDPEISVVAQLSPTLSDALPLFAQASAQGGALAWKSQGEVLATAPAWSFANKLIKKEYFETA